MRLVRVIVVIVIVIDARPLFLAARAVPRLEHRSL
jgi:hypothetical protein